MFLEPPFQKYQSLWGWLSRLLKYEEKVQINIGNKICSNLNSQALQAVQTWYFLRLQTFFWENQNGMRNYYPSNPRF